MTFQFPNRKTRRAMGLRVPVGLLTAEHEGLEVEQEVFIPRFVRRHFGAFAKATTRRERKARARIRRAIRPLGVTL